MILDDIVRQRRTDLARAMRETPRSRLEAAPGYAAARRGFVAGLREPPVAIIAEVKKASPSRGLIRADFESVALARSYEAGGAAAVSVLTEERFFQGSPAHLCQIRAAVDLPLLRKDFLFEPYQLSEARAWGADAVLLIVAMLDDVCLREMLAAAGELGLDSLVEVHTEVELERAVGAGAGLIGINNRNLRTFETRLENCERLRPLLPAEVLAVAESGIDSVADVERLRAASFRAFLIGESLMRAPDPARLLRELRGVK